MAIDTAPGTVTAPGPARELATVFAERGGPVAAEVASDHGQL